MDNKDEYINSLLLSLFLMQGEIDRLNQTLDLARKGELVYINNPQIEKLKAENDRLKEEIKKLEDFIKSDGEIDHINHEYTYKLKQTLQEIKDYLNTLSGIDNDFVNTETYLRILDLITKAESEG